MQTYLEVVVGLRDLLREQASRFRTQQDLLDYITWKTGHTFSKPTMSAWLLGTRYPDRRSRSILKDAFEVSDKKWWKLLQTDAVPEESLPASSEHARYG